jgi:hypothetical protein
MIVNCRRLRNILSFLPYLSVNCICASLPKIVDRIRLGGGEAPRAGLLKIIYTTVRERERERERERLVNSASLVIFLIYYYLRTRM